MTLKLLFAITPLLRTILFAGLVMEGHFTFGGGEKDVLLVVPLLLWSFAYLFCYLVLWWRRAAIKRAIAQSAGVATALVAIAWLAVLGISLRGSR